MEQVSAAPDFESLSRKLDALSEQVRFLTEQAQASLRRQQERAELVHDVMPIVNDGVSIATQQLEEVQEYVDLDDLLRLLKRLLRNGRNFDAMLDQLESLSDLARTIGPLSDNAFEKATDLLQRAEQRGYFVFTKGGARVVDKVVKSFDGEDLEQLGNNAVLILSVVKDMTQPQILHFLRDVMSQSGIALAAPVNTSFRSLLSQMRDPDVRRGLALTMRLMRVIGAQAGAAGAVGAAQGEAGRESAPKSG